MGILKDFDDYLNSITDERSKRSGFYGQSLCFMVSLCSVYLVFVLWLGPRLLKNRTALSLKRPIIFYNVLQVAANAYFVWRMFLYVFSGKDFSFFCNNIVYDEMDEYNMSVFHQIYYFYLLKCLDLMDTVFFVLRKKQNQITFLHVFHHSSLVFVMWMGLRFFPGGTALVTICINASVHVVMYGYYLMATLNLPGLRFIKPYITTLQLVQFVYNTGHLYLSIALGNCRHPLGFQYLIIALNIFFFWLFMRFYNESYRADSRKVTRKVK